MLTYSTPVRITIILAGITAIGTGCAAPKPIEVSLQYSVQETDNPETNLRGQTISLVPFADARGNKFLWKNRMIMNEGEDAGIWLANALRLELEQAGASVESLPAGSNPSTGVHVTGQVNVLEADSTGWQLGGLIAAAIATGYSPHIDVRVDLRQDGVPVFSKQYDLKQNVPSNAGGVILVGPSPANDIPRAFPIVLQKLIRTEILPDVERAIQGQTVSVASEER